MWRVGLASADGISNMDAGLRVAGGGGGGGGGGAHGSNTVCEWAPVSGKLAGAGHNM